MWLKAGSLNWSGGSGQAPAKADLARGNVHLAAIDMHVAVPYQLTSLAARHSKPHAIYDVVEATLELLQKHFAGDTLSRGGLLEVIPKLAFLGKVDAFGFLFFT